MWAVNYSKRRQLAEFLGKKYDPANPCELTREQSVPYWTATEADMGTPGVVDAQETAWYVQGIYDSREAVTGNDSYNYKVMTRNKQDAAFVRCVREL